MKFNRKLFVLSALALTPSVIAAQAPAPETTAPAATAPLHYGAWGLDLSARDLSVKPGDDFDRYASGAWKAAHAIPADQTEIGAFNDVHERNRARVREIIASAPPSSQYGALYAAFMDEAKLEAIGDKPLRADLAQIAALPDKAAFTRFMGATQGGFGAAIVSAGPSPDTANAELNVLWIGQSGLGLPNRDYYLLDQFKTQRDAYLAYIARTFRMLGHADPAGDAARVLAFEHAIAEKSWAPAEQRDVDKINNPMSPAQLASFAPGLDWTAFLAGAGIGPQQRMIVTENTAIRDIAALYAATPLPTLKLWQEFHFADNAARLSLEGMGRQPVRIREDLVGR